MMEDVNEYDALAGATRVRDITSNAQSARILRRLRGNDPRFTSMTINFWSEDDDNYDPTDNGNEMGYLGHFIGVNKQLKSLRISNFIPEDINITRQHIELFFKGLCHNKSIERLYLTGMALNGVAYRLLDMNGFFKNNPNFTKLDIYECELDRQAISLLPFAQTLKNIRVEFAEMDDKILAELFRALGMLRRLENLSLVDCNIGRNSCAEVTRFLQRTDLNLRSLDLGDNSIDDAGIDALVPALPANSKLRILRLSSNHSITASGYQILATLFESPTSNITALDFSYSTIDDDGLEALISTPSSTNVKKLLLSDNPLITEGMADSL